MVPDPDSSTKPDADSRSSPSRRGEPRLPAVIAVVVAIVLYAALPTKLLVGPRYVLPVLEIALLVPLLVMNPVRFTRETRWSRTLSVLLVLVIAAANLGALGLLVKALVAAKISKGRDLLLAALLTSLLVIARAVSILQ